MSAAHPASPARVQAPAHTHFTAGMVKVTGVLLRDAEDRHSPGREGHAFVHAVISTGAGMPYEALQDMGASPSSHIAASEKARRLRRGAHVTAIAHGALLRTDHDLAVLRLQGLTDLIAHELPVHCTEKEPTP
jgi:hypothetical protein